MLTQMQLLSSNSRAEMVAVVAKVDSITTMRYKPQAQ